MFYCFGCHKGGGLFQFVMDVEKVAFLDAVELLAKKAGVEMPREEEEPGGIKRETFVELYRKVTGSFRWLLRESPTAETARRYLARRRVSDATAEAFQLGCAPPDRRWLHRFLSGKSYSQEFLARTGLFSEAARGGGAAVAVRGQDHLPDLRMRGARCSRSAGGRSARRSRST